MQDLKLGDVIQVIVEEKNSFGKTEHYSRKPFKYVVVELYKHFALCKRIGSGVKECFTWWDLRTNMVKKGKKNESK